MVVLLVALVLICMFALTWVVQLEQSDSLASFDNLIIYSKKTTTFSNEGSNARYRQAAPYQSVPNSSLKYNRLDNSLF